MNCVTIPDLDNPVMFHSDFKSISFVWNGQIWQLHADCMSSWKTNRQDSKTSAPYYEKLEEQVLTSPGLPRLQVHHDVQLQDQLWGWFHKWFK